MPKAISETPTSANAAAQPFILLIISIKVSLYDLISQTIHDLIVLFILERG
jgi:hypothetical protein